MLKSPSSRRKSKHQEIIINLVPMLDALVTLVSFLLLTMAFIAIVVIDTPAPSLAPPEEQLEKLKDKPLQLTAYVQESQLIISDWTGSRERHIIPNVADPKTGQSRPDLERFHQTLLEIKGRHQNETKLILKPESGVSYETIVGVMDSARAIEKTDPPLYKKNAAGIDEPEIKLFPEIIFGNILS